MLSYFAGVGIALIIIAGIGLYEANSPLFVFNVYSHNYNTYFAMLKPAIGNYVSDILQSNPDLTSSLDNVAFGWIGYAMLICGLYLVAVRFARGVILALWFAIPFIYLGLGSISLTKYIPVFYIGPRYALAFAPAVVLIVGIAFAKLIETAMREGKSSKAVICIFVIAATSFILFTSIKDCVFVQYSQLEATEPLIQIGAYLNNLPVNSTIYGPYAIPWTTYVDKNRNTVVTGYPLGVIGCHNATKLFKMGAGSFLVGQVPDYKNCSMELVMTPAQLPGLRNYTMFDNWGTDFYAYNIYSYPQNTTS